ncbi:MAG: hypothetical protein AAB614_00720 [Patescibacteria group bacterium]
MKQTSKLADKKANEIFHFLVIGILSVLTTLALFFLKFGMDKVTI